MIATKYNCFFFMFIATGDILSYVLSLIYHFSLSFVNGEFFFSFSYKLISAVIVRRGARRKTFSKPVCHVHFQKKKKENN